MINKTLWFTGLSGSGKTSIAKEFVRQNPTWVWFDGDTMRKGLCSDLGFSMVDREENIRRIAEISKELNNQNINVITTLITPTNKLRLLAKNIIGENFRLIYTNSSFEKCKQRDVKGLYKKALNNKIKNFTGLTSDFETPDFWFWCKELDTENMSIKECVDELNFINWSPTI